MFIFITEIVPLGIRQTDDYLCESNQHNRSGLIALGEIFMPGEAKPFVPLLLLRR